MSATPPAVQRSLTELTPLHEVAFLVVDLETTGLSPQRDRITEVGAVRARGGTVEAELRTFVHPGVPIPPAITALTGITDADVAGAPDIAAVLPMLLQLLEGAVLVAHNARFDLGFLRAAAERVGLGPLRPAVVDTAVLARRLIRDEVRDLRLGTLAQHFRAPVTPDHRALNDARATLHVLHALLERAGSLGTTSQEDLLGLCGPEGDRSHRRIGLVRDAPAAPGVYRFIAPDGTVLYVGRAVDLRRRLRSYFGQDTRRATADLVAATERVTWTVTATELEAAVLEVRELAALRPRANRRSTRSDPGTTIALTREPFPRLALTRGVPDGDDAALGPLARATAERALEGLEAVLRIRPCRMRLRRRQDHEACMLHALGRCDAVCDGTQTPAGYATLVAEARDALRDPGAALPALTAQMRARAAAGEFERAVALREQLGALIAGYEATRRHRWLAATGIIASRPAGDGATEVVAIVAGSLHGSVRVAAKDVDDAVITLRTGILAGAEEVPPGRAELALVGAWLEGTDVVPHHVEGMLASPLAGGLLLAHLGAELRAAQRAVRGDDDLIEGRKVRRRTTAEVRRGRPRAAT